MSGPASPPPGSGIPSPDVASMMQQFAAGGAKNTAGGATGSAPSMPGVPGSAAAPQNQKPARPVGTPVQELKYLGGDVVEELLSLFPTEIRALFGGKKNYTPEEQKRLQEFHQKYTAASQADQMAIRQRAAERQKQAQALEAERRQKAAQEQQKTQDSSSDMPQGKTGGPDAGLGKPPKKSTMAIADLNKKRKQLADPV